MMTWLQNFGGYTSSGLTKDEKKELEQLRIKVKEYREYEKHKNKKEEEEEKSISDEDSDDIDPSLDNLIEKMPEQKKKQSLLPRSAVSAEAYGDYNKKENFKARYIEKTQEQIQRIKSMIIHCLPSVITRSGRCSHICPCSVDKIVHSLNRVQRGENQSATCGLDKRFSNKEEI